MLSALLASIPSPSIDVLELGPISLHLYGLCIALGVVAAVTLSSRRWEARGGNPEDIGTIAIWAVPAGVIGARLYHVATDWKTYRGNWGEAFNITNGGLGIPGGVALGVLVGLLVVRSKKLPSLDLLDVVAPAIPIAQAIGRLGNWFNQELYGRPTKLPWGLEIDDEHLVPGYASGTTFHPTFLYEALWNLALAGLLIVLDRRKTLRRGELFTLYVFGYALGRLWVEDLRIDNASLLWGIRVNIWMSVITGVVAAIVLAKNRLRPKVETETETEAVAVEPDAAGPDAVDADGPGAAEVQVDVAGDEVEADAPDAVVLGGRRPVVDDDVPPTGDDPSGS